MASRSQPGDDFYEIGFGHRRAAGGGMIYAAPNMKENRTACARHRRVGVVPDLNKPVIRKIAGTHFFVSVIVWRIFRIDNDVAIVIG